MPRGYPGSGWSRSEAHHGGGTFCRQCGREVSCKPTACRSAGHRRFYERYRERMRLYMRTKYVPSDKSMGPRV